MRLDEEVAVGFTFGKLFHQDFALEVDSSSEHVGYPIRGWKRASN